MRRPGPVRLAIHAVTVLLLGVAAADVLAAQDDGVVIGATKVLDCGPAGDRLNIVLIAEGFQFAELPAFATAAQAFQEALLATPPFHEASGINVWRIDVASTDSGADTFPDGCAGPGQFVRTYFDASFCIAGLDRLLAVDDAAVIDLATAHVPEWDVMLVIVNTPIFGASAGLNVAVTAIFSEWESIAIHELGHSLFGLADEYEHLAGCGIGETGHDRHPGEFEPIEPNVTIETDRARIKWGDLISPTTPIPSSINADCALCDPQVNPLPDGTVGLFEGARYHHCGAYRPQFDCRMRGDAPFCAVCSRRIREVLASYASTAAICGDADGNGDVSVTDGVIVLRAAAGLPASCTAACDVDGDGSLTVTDGVNVLRKSAALPSAENCPVGICQP